MLTNRLKATIKLEIYSITIASVMKFYAQNYTSKLKQLPTLMVLMTRNISV